MVETWADAELADAARSALDRIRGVLPRPLSRAMDATTLLTTPAGFAPKPPEHLGALRDAVARHREVFFEYADAKGILTERRARPIGLWFWGSRWTLAAWCLLRDDYRNFRPDRMDTLTVTSTRFDPEHHPLDDFLAAMRARR